jgi:hypothetical protein
MLEGEVWVHAFMTLALSKMGDQLYKLTALPGVKASGPHYVGGFVAPGAGQDAL